MGQPAFVPDSDDLFCSPFTLIRCSPDDRFFSLIRVY